MCICINCKFYQSCWIKQGLTKIPKNFLKIPLTFTKKGLEKTSNYSRNIKESLSLKIRLNRFCHKNTFEFDVIECEGFCENPGNWLN